MTNFDWTKLEKYAVTVPRPGKILPEPLFGINGTSKKMLLAISESSKIPKEVRELAKEVSMAPIGTTIPLDAWEAFLDVVDKITDTKLERTLDALSRNSG